MNCSTPISYVVITLYGHDSVSVHHVPEAIYFECISRNSHQTSTFLGAVRSITKFLFPILKTFQKISSLQSHVEDLDQMQSESWVRINSTVIAWLSDAGWPIEQLKMVCGIILTNSFQVQKIDLVKIYCYQ